jgi:hypothetical protein
MIFLSIDNDFDYSDMAGWKMGGFMIKKFSRSWALLKAAGGVLIEEPKLMFLSLFWLFGCGVLIVITIQFHEILQYVSVFEVIFSLAIIFCIYFLFTFINTAIVTCAMAHLQGKENTLADGLRKAFSCIRLIFVWALFSIVVGVVLGMIEDKLKYFGRVLAKTISIGFALASFLVIPIIIVKKTGVRESMQKSTQMLEKTFGEQLISSMSLNLIASILAFIPFGLIVEGLLDNRPSLFWIGLSLIAVIIVVQTTLSCILRAALYLYASDGKVPHLFRDNVFAKALIKQ